MNFTRINVIYTPLSCYINKWSVLWKPPGNGFIGATEVIGVKYIDTLGVVPGELVKDMNIVFQQDVHLIDTSFIYGENILWP